MLEMRFLSLEKPGYSDYYPIYLAHLLFRRVIALKIEQP